MSSIENPRFALECDNGGMEQMVLALLDSEHSLTRDLYIRMGPNPAPASNPTCGRRPTRELFRRVSFKRRARSFSGIFFAGIMLRHASNN